MSLNSSPSSSLNLSAAEVLSDYRLVYQSRAASLLGRKEVLSGKAKFGIFGDGKELAQVALARAFQPGDWRSGYYRDQTWMFAVGVTNIPQFFAQLYADTDPEREPASRGRQMNGHFASRFRDSEGQWLNQLLMPNSAADASPTAAQMGRLVGLGYASKYYRAFPQLSSQSPFSAGGNEVCFGTIGNASTSEGLFWEALNACGVLGLPVVISVWDDDYGISVPNKYQTTKESISAVAAGFQRTAGTNGFEILQVRGWDYPALLRTYADAATLARTAHVPVLIHVTEMTQPQGHSTSGSHERYKSPERLQHEQDKDCLALFRAWLISAGYATTAAVAKLEAEAQAEVEAWRQGAWDDYQAPLLAERAELLTLLRTLPTSPALTIAENAISRAPQLNRRTMQSAVRRLLWTVSDLSADDKVGLKDWLAASTAGNAQRYHAYALSDSAASPLCVAAVALEYAADPEVVDGRQIIQRFFDHHLAHDPRIFIIGEDVGKLGGVNLEFDGLSDRHGEMRVTDTGIREATILGQGMGAAMRGLRPIVDIQYLDYLLYCFQLLSDDLATLHYRTAGGQSAPCIIRTKGHRLEGIWHTGSPLGMILHGLRGIHVCVPRNMVQAAGFYNTLLQGDDPALVIEVLNGYRLKEKVPANLYDFTLPLGVPEILQVGTDLTLVTYGACVRVAEEAHSLLAAVGISVELIDVQTLLPFDRPQLIRSSLEKTGALLCLDEDVPGGATSYMLQQILEEQGGYELLDAPPRTLTAAAHRSPFGSDGDYCSKPSADDVFELVYAMLRERRPADFAEL